jgi:hypothetical protein
VTPVQGRPASEFFNRNVFLSFQEDALGIRDRDLIGIDQMMSGSGYPHTESTFPQSRKLLDRVFAGVPDEAAAPHHARQCRPAVRLRGEVAPASWSARWETGPKFSRA